MENLNYKSETIERKYLKNMQKNQFFKAKSNHLDLKKDFIELIDKELKDREIKIKREIEELFFKPIIVSIDHMDIYTFTCDAPARALLKGIVQHTGYYACERCTMKGTSIRGRIVYDRTEKSTLRSNDIFMLIGYAEKDEIGKSHQLAPSPIRRLNIKMINDFNLDYMHMVCLGVVRRMLYYFKGLIGRLSQGRLNEITSRLLSFKGKLPSEFAKQPRSLNELDRWKATELRSFLLYTGPVALKGILSSSYYEHFLSVSLSMRILCDDNEMKRNFLLESAKELLNYFVYNSKECYGDTFCVYNVHGLIHIADDVEYFKESLQATSAFAFENYLQELKRFVRSRHNPVAQIMKRLGELEGLSREQKSLQLKASDNIRDSCFLVESGIVIIQSKLHNGDFVCDFFIKYFLKTFLVHLSHLSNLIFYVKGHIQLRHIINRQADFIRKCVYLPHKSGHVVLPVLNDIN